MATMAMMSGHSSSGEFALADLERAEDVDRKQLLIAELLAERQLDALVLQQPENFAWFTTGGDATHRSSVEPHAALFLTKDARVVACPNSATTQIFDSELPGLGFQLKERPWSEPRGVLLGDLCRGRQIGCDQHFPGAINMAPELLKLRSALSDYEGERMRLLGRQIAHAVEATARSLEPGRSEAEIAGELSHRLLKHEILPVQVQVLADGRRRNARHWSFSADPVRGWCTLKVIGMRWGLHLGVARTVAFGQPDESLLTAHQQASMLLATGMYFSQAQRPLQETFERVRRIYEKLSYPEDWRLSEQGEIIGYQPSEIPITPQSAVTLPAGACAFWHPSIQGVTTGDSILLRNESAEWLTPVEQWPTLSIGVKDAVVTCPGLLCREL